MLAFTRYIFYRPPRELLVRHYTLFTQVFSSHLSLLTSTRSKMPRVCCPRNHTGSTMICGQPCTSCLHCNQYCSGNGPTGPISDSPASSGADGNSITPPSSVSIATTAGGGIITSPSSI